MGKHSMENTTKKIKLKIIIGSVIIIAILLLGMYFLIKYNPISNTTEKSNIKNSKTIEGKKLVIKSNADYSKYIEYTFEDEVLKSVKIYEQFETEEKYNKKMNSYKLQNNITILNNDEKKKIIEIEKSDLGTDEGLTYEQIYDKYIAQIIGAYEVIE